MIKLPKEVNNIITQLNTKGFECYAVGGCVRDAMLGQKPIDWDLATNAKLSDMQEIFEDNPKAKLLSEKYSVFRLDFTKDEDDETSPIVDIATFRKEKDFDKFGQPSTIEFVETIEEDLARRDFTINAMADNPQKRFVDVYDGKNALKQKVICAVGDANTRFQEDPLRILRAVRFAAEKNFEIEIKTYDAMEANSHLLGEIAIDKKVTEEFEKILGAEFASKGLKILQDIGALVPLTNGAIKKIPLRKKDLLNRLMRNIDKTYPIANRRLGLFYGILGESAGREAIEYLNFDKETKEHLFDAITMLSSLGAIKDDFELKDFIAEIGRDRYLYLEDLAADKVVAFKGTARRVNKRSNMLKKIESNREPIFMEDLLINGNDLKDALGLEGKDIGDMLELLLIEVHRKPYKNNRIALLEIAESYKNSAFKGKLRRNKWLKRLK